MFRSILVALDGSRLDAPVLEEAISLARSHRARLTLICVATPPRWRIAGPYIPPFATDAELQHCAEEVVARAEAQVPDDVPVSTVVRNGSPAEAILKRIETGEHDLVVMGSRGHREAVSLLIGSVSGEVADRSPVPVLIVRSRRRAAVTR